MTENPADVELTPPDPIEHEDGSVEWPTDPNFVPTEEDKDLTPVEGDEDDYAEPDEGADEAWEDEQTPDEEED